MIADYRQVALSGQQRHGSTGWSRQDRVGYRLHQAVITSAASRLHWLVTPRQSRLQATSSYHYIGSVTAPLQRHGSTGCSHQDRVGYRLHQAVIISAASRLHWLVTPRQSRLQATSSYHYIGSVTAPLQRLGSTGLSRQDRVGYRLHQAIIISAASQLHWLVTPRQSRLQATSSCHYIGSVHSSTGWSHQDRVGYIRLHQAVIISAASQLHWLVTPRQSRLQATSSCHYIGSVTAPLQRHGSTGWSRQDRVGYRLHQAIITSAASRLHWLVTPRQKSLRIPLTRPPGATPVMAADLEVTARLPVEPVDQPDSPDTLAIPRSPPFSEPVSAWRNHARWRFSLTIKTKAQQPSSTYCHDLALVLMLADATHCHHDSDSLLSAHTQPDVIGVFDVIRTGQKVPKNRTQPSFRLDPSQEASVISLKRFRISRLIIVQ
ncbi:hypothetical protein RRG08_055561 [Elysia crispata]|uniref:Uncharacterized protein n=1 Tax=Elysia crispata TaxID=231223 RepID=A0AAE1DWL2_9GAST|nr:hypothetical protein RRG08_055561 [Elysia crispata]